MTKVDLLQWLVEKQAEAKRSLLARQEAASVWSGGDGKLWRAVGCTMNKAARLKHAAIEARIAAKYQRDVDMFEAAIDVLSRTE